MTVLCLNIAAQSDFVKVVDGHFFKDGKPYYYVGTNFWYGAILGLTSIATCLPSESSK